MAAEKTILVAEDDPNDAFLLERAFARTGERVNVEFVRDGEEALHYLQSDKPLPDLLLVDLKMPKVDGFQVLQWVRSQPALKRMLVVVLTSSAQKRDVNRAYDLGANSYLVKPVNLEDLLKLARLVRDYWVEANEPPEHGLRAARHSGG